MKSITFELHGDMEQYAGDIQQFVSLMLHKLHKNVHKGRWEGVNTGDAFIYLSDEVIELYDALRAKNAEETYLECADVANFAMIIASITRDKTATVGSNSSELIAK